LTAFVTAVVNLLNPGQATIYFVKAAKKKRKKKLMTMKKIIYFFNKEV